MRFAITALLLAALSSLSFAGGSGDSHTPPPPQQSQPTTSTSGAGADAAAGAAAGAAARSGASATGGAGGAGGVGTGTGTGGSNSLGSVGNDNSTSKFSALALALPAPVFVPPMPAIGDCPSAMVTQSARAIGWNFVSWSDSKIDTDNCTVIKVYGSLMQRCKYRSASLVLAHLTVKVLPDYRPEEGADLDLTDKECRDLSLPVTAPVQVSPINFVSAIPAACVPAVRPRGKVVKRKPAAVCK